MHRRAPFTFALVNICGLQLLGTLMFSHLEKWSLIEGFYYTGMMITTIGTNNPSPSTSGTKILSVLFAYYSITLALYSIGVLKPRMDEIVTEVFDRIIFWKKIG